MCLSSIPHVSSVLSFERSFFLHKLEAFCVLAHAATDKKTIVNGLHEVEPKWKATLSLVRLNLLKFGAIAKHCFFVVEKDVIQLVMC